MTIATYEEKEGRNYKALHTINNFEEATHRLAANLAAKYIGKAQYIRSIRRRNNYNGTQTYTVQYDHGGRMVYVTDIY